MVDEAFLVTRREIIGLLIRFLALSAISYYTFHIVADAVDPTRKKKRQIEGKVKKLMQEIGVRTDTLNEYELIIASNLVDKRTITENYEDIAGMQWIIEEMKASVVFPVKNHKIFAGSELLKAPKGVLLHGPPGCGKTLLAKATAKEVDAQFIYLDGSTLHDKWYGESQKLSRAVFTLAEKIQPCFIFIDEIDSLLRNRIASDHEASTSIKALFMEMWDGLTTNPNSTVIVMGATNRPRYVDQAILRRMPVTFYIGLPNVQQRESILKQILKNEEKSENIDFFQLASVTETFSGSDLKEVCRAASVYRIRENLSQGNKGIRPLETDDLLHVVAKLKGSKVKCDVDSCLE